MKNFPARNLSLPMKKGSEIDRWVSTDAPHYMEKLPAGKYTLTEVTAPDGYAIAERMEFEVLPNGEVQTFEMFDDTIKVKNFQGRHHHQRRTSRRRTGYQGQGRHRD